MNHPRKTMVGLCETQPASAEGIRSLLAATPDFECAWVAEGLPMALALMRQQPVDLVLVDKAFTLAAAPEQGPALEGLRAGAALVVWGTAMSEPEALRLLQSGARGILRRTADLATILRCFRSVASGEAWLEDCVFRDPGRPERAARSTLTSREQQVLELVEQGMRNKEIASKLGIRPGTVKIHLKHIFEKTGVHGRYGLALNGLRQKGLLALSRTHELRGEPGREISQEVRVLKAS
jgi:DNA-binding NarL/FixJ family response regulator